VVPIFGELEAQLPHLDGKRNVHALGGTVLTFNDHIPRCASSAILIGLTIRPVILYLVL
jgi:hypothetical protein